MQKSNQITSLMHTRGSCIQEQWIHFKHNDKEKTMDINENSNVMGKSGILADGRKVNVRQVSSAGCPTLEIRTCHK